MLRPSAEPRRKFSIIWGEKTTSQHAIDMELFRVSQLYHLRLGMEKWFCLPHDAADGFRVQADAMDCGKHYDVRLMNVYNRISTLQQDGKEVLVVMNES